MIRIIYPENRMVDEETVIGWARDENINEELGYPEEEIDIYLAKEILDDSGKFTFARPTHDNERFVKDPDSFLMFD